MVLNSPIQGCWLRISLRQGRSFLGRCGKHRVSTWCIAESTTWVGAMWMDCGSFVLALCERNFFLIAASDFVMKACAPLFGF